MGVVAVESKGFLGGKYVEPVQVIAGEVQTFTARQAATGRSVYVHQITGTTRGEQTKLLKLLLMCLYRIPAVKERVLDISDEGETYYVVTESSPPYLLLKDWLQREWEKAEGISEQSAPEAGPAAHRRSEQAFRPEAPGEGVQRPTPPTQFFGHALPPSGIPPAAPSAGKSSDDAGEFTRLFQQADFHQPSAAVPSEHVQRPAAPSAKPAKPAAQPEASRKPGVPNTAENSPGHRDAAGETQLFSPASRNSKQTEQRPIQSSPMRPVTPVPPSPVAGASLEKSSPGLKPGVDERAEHTRLFLTPSPFETQEKPNPGGARPADPVIAGKPDSPKTPEAPRSVPGEFTKLFNADPTASRPRSPHFPLIRNPRRLIKMHRASSRDSFRPKCRNRIALLRRCRECSALRLHPGRLRVRAPLRSREHRASSRNSFPAGHLLAHQRLAHLRLVQDGKGGDQSPQLH